MLEVFIISMKTDADRRRNISEKLNGFGISFTFIDAVIGKNLSNDFLSNMDFSGVIRRKQRSVTPGEIGCTLSHIQAYKRMLDLNIKSALILEDDVIFDHRLADFIKKYDYSSNGKELLILGGQNGIASSKYISRSIWGKVNIGGQIFHQTIKSEASIYRTCCYVLSAEIANELIELSKKGFFIADEWSYFKDNNVFNKILLSDFVDHPLDLSTSHIEIERLNSKPIKTTQNSAVKSFLKKHLYLARIKKELIYIRSFIRCLYVK